MLFALIFDNKVVQIEPAEFPVSPALKWVDITGVTPIPEVSWSYDGRDFTAPPVPIRPPKSEAPLSAEELATHLVAKSLTTRAELDAIKTSR